MIIGKLYRIRWYNVALCKFEVYTDFEIKEDIRCLERNELVLLLAIDDIRDGYAKVLTSNATVGWIDYSDKSYFESGFELVSWIDLDFD